MSHHVSNMFLISEDGKPQKVSFEKLPILPEWNDQLSLPPSFEEHMKKVENDKLSTKKDK